jgi:hypothetical protein
VQYTFNLDRCNRGSLDGRKQHTPERVANGCTKPAFERLCPEVTVLVSQCLGVSGQSFRFLKAFPKHLLLLYLFGRAARETIKVRRLIWLEGL